MKVVVKPNYNQSIRINNRDIKCYSRKMLKEMYPKGNYVLVGETFENNKKDEIDTLYLAKKELRVSEYGKNNTILYARSGYIAVGDNLYVAILQNRIPFILLFLLLFLLGTTVSVLGYKLLSKTPTVAPEYPLPPEDNKSEDIQDDNSVNPEVGEKNYASIKVAREVSVNLKNRQVTLLYQNFNASNKDAVVSLCVLKDNNEYIIARSGLIKVGKEIKTMKLDDNAIKLVQGVYKGRIKVDFYNETTGEKAATTTDFDDVEITVK